MQTEKVPYIKQIFVCTNNREGQSASCGDHQSEEIFKELRRIAKERGLHPRIRVAQAKCLGRCSTGTNIMVYPDDIWHRDVHLEDVKGLADKYLSSRGVLKASTAHPEERSDEGSQGVAK